MAFATKFLKTTPFRDNNASGQDRADCVLGFQSSSEPGGNAEVEGFELAFDEFRGNRARPIRSDARYQRRDLNSANLGDVDYVPAEFLSTKRMRVTPRGELTCQRECNESFHHEIMKTNEDIYNL
jgi:hypothetical protein